MKDVIRGTALFASYTLLSRILGFIRDLLVAALLGASTLADAFFVAFRIPNLLRSLVAEGALSSAFVPVFSSNTNDIDKSKIIFKQTSAWLIIITIFLTLIGIFFAPIIVDFFAPRFLPETKLHTALLLQIMMPYIIFVSLVALSAGALTSLKHFASAAQAQILMNSLLIIGALIAVFYKQYATVILSSSVLIGGIAQLWWQQRGLQKYGLSISFCPVLPLTKDVKKIFSLFAPAILGASVYQLLIFFSTRFATYFDSGAVSWVFYADRVVQLPVGIFIVALGTTILPALSKQYAEQDKAQYCNTITKGITYSNLALIPLAVFIFVYASDCISLLFERGAFTATDTARAAPVAQGYAIGIIIMGWQSVLSKAALARKDTVTTTLIGAVGLISFVAATFILCGPAISNYYLFNLGLPGLSVASSLGSLSSVVLLLIILKKWEPTLSLHEGYSSLIQESAIWGLIGGIAHFYELNFYLGSLVFILVLAVRVLRLRTR